MRELKALSDQFRAAKQWLDYRAALICSVLANGLFDTKKRGKPFLVSDFMPDSQIHGRQQTAQQMWDTARSLTTMLGGKIIETEAPNVN